jgi:hypothetical protein
MQRWEASRMEYRFYFLGPDCRVYGRREFHADNDGAAIEMAWTIFRTAPVPHHGFELWQEKRHVHTEGC